MVRRERYITTLIKITCTDYMYRRNSIGCVVNVDEMLKVGEAIFKNVHLRMVAQPLHSTNML